VTKTRGWVTESRSINKKAEDKKEALSLHPSAHSPPVSILRNEFKARPTSFFIRQKWDIQFNERHALRVFFFLLSFSSFCQDENKFLSSSSCLRFRRKQWKRPLGTEPVCSLSGSCSSFLGFCLLSSNQPSVNYFVPKALYTEELGSQFISTLLGWAVFDGGQGIMTAGGTEKVPETNIPVSSPARHERWILRLFCIDIFHVDTVNMFTIILTRESSTGH